MPLTFPRLQRTVGGRTAHAAPRVRAVRTALALLLIAGTASDPRDSGAQGAQPASTGSTTSSASAPGAGARTPSACPVPVCRYEGTAWAEDLIGDELLDRGEARVTWTFSHMDGREAVYVASGRVTARWTSDRCSIALHPAAEDFTPRSPDARHTRLRVDFTALPVRYSGTGSSEWSGTQTWTCPNGSPWTEEGVATKWFVAEAMTSADRGLLEGTFTTETGRSGWEFRTAP